MFDDLSNESTFLGHPVDESLLSHSDVKIKKSNSECKMSRFNAVFQFRMRNVKA